MIKEAIILAGGLGTRLREAVPDLPKAMATVAGKPFLSFVIDHLRMQGIEKIIFSLGYKAEIIETFLKESYPTLNFDIVVEQEPLGTGGAIHLALQKTTSEDVIVANGDTLFRTNLRELASVHKSKKAECTLALKPMKHFSRYGIVEIDSQNRVTHFREKQEYDAGLINGGIYILNSNTFRKREYPQRFSFEKEYLEKFCAEGNVYGVEQDEYFIDIGVPEDYQQAQIDLKKEPLDLKKVNKRWTLFLDRDGVINDEKVGEYVLHWGEFIFSKGVLDVFKKLSEKFGRIIIVSNQRGVGKGLMTEEALQSIHLEMEREVQIVGGHIDKIYYCTDTEAKSFFRKPNPGMAFRAAEDFAEIDFSKAIMVGNKLTDMKFGKFAGMYTVFVTTTNPEQAFPHPDIDASFSSLQEFASSFE